MEEFVIELSDVSVHIFAASVRKMLTIKQPALKSSELD